MLGFDPSILNSGSNSDYIFMEGPNKPSRGRFEYAFSRIGLSFLTGGAIGWAIGGYNGIKNSRLDQMRHSMAANLTQEAATTEASSAAAASSPSTGSKTSPGGGFSSPFGSGSQSSSFRTQSWAVRRSHILNYITKTGANTANTFGIIALTYSVIHLGISFVTDREDVTTLAAATSTGSIYRYVANPRPQTDKVGLVIRQTITRQMRAKRAAVGGLMGVTAGIVFILLTKENKYLITPPSQFL